MCGIAGILSTTSMESIATSIRGAQTALSHRGPDDQGIYLTPDRKTALTHTRLSILDLTSAGHQPMSIEDGRYWITFNGEIYNFLELRQQLETEGEKFYSHTDTEVILRLYQRKGKEFVKNLRGMFAFAIWDNQEKTCFLARDPLGIKPLYFSKIGKTFIFASELKAILATQQISIQLNPEALYQYFCWGTVPEPLTLIQAIEQVPAGNCLIWKNGETTQQCYWYPDFTPQSSLTPQDSKEIVRQALIDSVKHHFISDVPVGIFLSGGLDSTTLLALAFQTQSESLQTYSIVFEDESFNEGAIAAQTAKHFQTQHHEYCLTPELGQTIFQQYLDSLDQPTIDGFNTFTVAQLAANNGTKVVLSGLGGDELFGGYGSFSVIPKMLRWRSHLQAFTPISQLFGKILSQTTIVDSKIKRLGDFLQAPSTNQSAYQCMRGIFSQQEALTLTQFYCPDWQYQPLNFLQNPQDSFSCPTISDEISWLELSQYMRNQLLRDSDVMSMRQGLELRVPFVDQVLLEAIAPIPSQWRLAQGKQLLKEAIPEIPPWVLNRPKKGFIFPLQKWFDKSWVQTFTDLSSVPKSINLDLWYRRLAVINLNYWLYTLN